MDLIEDHIFPVVGTGVSGNDPGAATDNHLVDIATDPDFLMAVGDGHGIVIRPVAHQGQRVDPRTLLVARVERCRQWPLQRFEVTHKPFVDALVVAAQDVALPVAALLFQAGHCTQYQLAIRGSGVMKFLSTPE